jgi:hypothetical protein
MKLVGRIMVTIGVLAAGVSGLGSLLFLLLVYEPRPQSSGVIWFPISFWLRDVAILGGPPFVIGLILLLTGLVIIRYSGRR